MEENNFLPLLSELYGKSPGDPWPGNFMAHHLYISCVIDIIIKARALLPPPPHCPFCETMNADDLVS